MPKRVKNVWGVACPRCHAPTDSACRDLRSSTGLLFGRRTHKERAKALTAQPAVEEWVRVPRGTPIFYNPVAFTTTTSAGTLVTDEQWYRGAIGWSPTSTAATTIDGNWITMTPTTNTMTIQPAAYTQTWGQWIDNPPAYEFNGEVWRQWAEDDEQRIARMERERQYRDELQARREQDSRERLAREQEQMENRLVAHARALDLLDGLLSETEREQRLVENEVTVLGSDGLLYRIEMNRETVHGNIVRTDEHGCSLGRACVAPAMYEAGGTLPTPDGWVGQYLGLKFDAVTFLSHANWSGVRECSRRAA